MPNLARSALWYARHGWRVFPCLAAKKEPAINSWQKLATTDLRQVEAWWRVRPDSNIGVACGEDSDLYVVDVDQHGLDGEQTMTAVIRRLGELPATVEQRTGSGGRQLFLRYPVGHVCRNTAGSKRGLGPGIDTRGAGGFVVVPPSLHPCGERYRWITGPHQAQPAELPAAWVERLERKEAVTISVPLPAMRTWGEYGGNVVARRADAIARQGQGNRNDELYRGAFYLAKLAQSGLVVWLEAKAELERAGRSCGLEDFEVNRTIASAASGAGLVR